MCILSAHLSRPTFWVWGQTRLWFRRTGQGQHDERDGTGGTGLVSPRSRGHGQGLIPVWQRQGLLSAPPPLAPVTLLLIGHTPNR